MTEKHEVRKVSFWFDGPTHSVEPTSAHLYDKDDHFKLKLKRRDLKDTAIPVDARDWCVTVTTDDGEHYHGEVKAYGTGYWRVYKWPKRGLIMTP